MGGQRYGIREGKVAETIKEGEGRPGGEGRMGHGRIEIWDKGRDKERIGRRGYHTS